MPYSLIESLRRTADSRSATLWALEPVRWASRFPKHSGSTIRSSTRVPSWAMQVALASPRPSTSVTQSEAVKASMTSPGLRAAQTMSMSLAVSA